MTVLRKCEICRRRKVKVMPTSWKKFHSSAKLSIQCGEQQPTCQQCQAAGRPCLYRRSADDAFVDESVKWKKEVNTTLACTDGSHPPCTTANASNGHASSASMSRSVSLRFKRAKDTYGAGQYIVFSTKSARPRVRKPHWNDIASNRDRSSSRSMATLPSLRAPPSSVPRLALEWTAVLSMLPGAGSAKAFDAWTTYIPGSVGDAVYLDHATQYYMASMRCSLVPHEATQRKASAIGALAVKHLREAIERNYDGRDLANLLLTMVLHRYAEVGCWTQLTTCCLTEAVGGIEFERSQNREPRPSHQGRHTTAAIPISEHTQR